MSNSKHLFLDIHVIQTLPPSNINRDDTGSPKTANYGGVRRARVSSQAWKKAMREYFKDNMESSAIGVRTKEVVRYVADKIIKQDASIGDEKAMEISEQALNKAGISTKDQKAKALFFIGDRQAEDIAKAALAGEQDKEKLQAMLNSNKAVDIALFGRMVADDPLLNEDASSQIAHAISTHAVQTEFDYYTAMDDYKKDVDSGAGMLGNIEFNSSTLYRYGNLAIHEFAKQLKDKEVVLKSVQLFVEAFCKSMPTGKINSFANQTYPQLVAISLRHDRPVNLISAFEEPVISKEGFVKKSIEKLDAECGKAKKFTDETETSFFVVTEDMKDIKNLGKEEQTLSLLLKDLYDFLTSENLYEEV